MQVMAPTLRLTVSMIFGKKMQCKSQLPKDSTSLQSVRFQLAISLRLS